MHWTERLVAFACRVKRGGVILNYHTLTAEQARAHVELWAAHFEFIHHDQLTERLQSPGKKPFCLLTFDDGKKSNAVETAPVLTRLGVPAVFYLVTKFTSGELPVLWFDAYRAFLKRFAKCPPELEPRRVKRLPQREREKLLDEAYREHGFRPEIDAQCAAALSWDEARALQSQGHSIGAHSETHAILTTLPQSEAQREIARSIATISEQLGSPCGSFAFPNGNYTDELARYALGCGVRTVMTTEPTWAGRSEQLWRLPRVQIYETQPLSRQRVKLFLASFGRLLGNPDGTGRQYVRTVRAARERLSDIHSEPQA